MLTSTQTEGLRCLILALPGVTQRSEILLVVRKMDEIRVGRHMIPIWEGNPVPGSSQYQGDLIMDPNVGTRQERKDLPTTLIMTGVLMAKKIRDRQIMAGRITCPDRHHRDYQMAEKICCRGRPLAIDTE
jgi:hypothetical protein